MSAGPLRKQNAREDFITALCASLIQSALFAADSPDWYEWAQCVLYTMNKPLYLVYQLVVVERGFVDLRLQQEVIGGGVDLF